MVEVYSLEYEPIVKAGEFAGTKPKFTRLAEYADPGKAMVAIRGGARGMFVVCEPGSDPNDWRPVLRTDDGTVYNAWGPGAALKRSYYAGQS